MDDSDEARRRAFAESEPARWAGYSRQMVLALRDYLTPIFESEDGPEVEAVALALTRLEAALDQLEASLGGGTHQREA